MAVQRRGDLHLDTAVCFSRRVNQPRQVALHMRSERQEVGNHHDALGAAFHQQPGRARQIRLAEFQERCFYDVPARVRHLRGDIAHGLIGALDA